MAKKVTIEWTNEVTIEHKATVKLKDWEEAQQEYDGGDSFLAELETEHTEQSYVVDERTATIDGEQVYP